MTVTIRPLRAADIELGDSLRALANWNQTRADWQRILSLEPEGCFVAEWHGQPVGTTTTTCYGTELAWIGMVLVHPDFRGRGIGRALMDHCLDYLKRRGLRSIMLDATPLGEQLYSKLGFSVLSRLGRWERDAASSRSHTAHSNNAHAADVEPALWPEVVRFDAQVFGVPRERLLDELKLHGYPIKAVVADEKLAGFGMMRPGAVAEYLGPVEANTPADAERLLASLIAAAEGKRLYWDIPEENGPAIAIAEKLGFRRQRPLSRMLHGAAPPAGDATRLYAIADPACG